MSVSRAKELYMEDATTSNDVCVLYEPRSDFINLSKLNYLGLARKLEAMKRKEYQRTLTLKRWIWENVVGVIRLHSKQCEDKMEYEMRT